MLDINDQTSMILVKRTDMGIEIVNQDNDYLDPDEVIRYFREVKIEWKKQSDKMRAENGK